MKYILALVFLLSVLAVLPQETTVTYTEDHSVFANPERGFYHHTEVSSTNYQLLNQSTLEQYRTQQGITQILRVFYLEDFKEGPISEEYLDNVRRDFSTIRKAGMKSIVRFAYTKKSTAPYGDAPLEIVLVHIHQLQPVFEENQDVIAVVQAGFVGAWGEWYYTDHFSEILGGPTEEDWAKRQALIYALLDALPESRSIQLRTPAIKMNITEDPAPLSAEEAFSTSPKARLGHHNDCFVASSSDYGTYINPSVEKPFLEQETKFLPMGGETCALAPPYSDCENATSELERFHWSYLNIDYNTSVLDVWGDQGCFDEVERKLGYRFKLIESRASTEVKPGYGLNAEVSLENLGYANPYNKRLFELVLKHQISEEEYYLPTDIDPRLWELEGAFSLSLSGRVPESAKEGIYDLYIHMPDPLYGLYGRPEYAIRLANENVWDPDNGYNDLGIDVTISNEAAETAGDEVFFILRSAFSSPSLDLDPIIRAGAGNDEIVLFWGADDPEKIRVIERAQDSGNYEFLAALPAHALYFTDFDPQPGTDYQYRFFLLSDHQVSNYSDTLNVMPATSTEPNIHIIVDGNDLDWAAIPPVATTSAGGFKASRIFFDTKNVYFVLYNAPDLYEIYLNTDHDEKTGLGLAAGGHGYDFLIRGDSLFEVNANNWQYSHAEVKRSTAGTLTELAISQNHFSNLGNNPLIGIAVVFMQNDQQVFLTSATGEANMYVRGLPPDIPEGLEVRKSNALPESRLQLSWSACNNCLGYHLERSVNGGTVFEDIASYNANVTNYNDNHLQNNTTYYYRMSSYNKLGTSSYSDIVSATTGLDPLTSEATPPLIYPNPSQGVLNISKSYERLEIRTLAGQLVMDKRYQAVIDVSHLPQGTYILRLFEKDTFRQHKLLIGFKQ